MDELEFAQRLKRYRRERGLTQQELAERIGVSNKSVSRWESGSYPDVPTLVSLARALDVTVDALLDPGAPVPTLQKSDWQNLLSFAFTIGGDWSFICWSGSSPCRCAGPSIWAVWPTAPISRPTTPVTPAGSAWAAGPCAFSSAGPWRESWGAWCFRCCFPQS